MKKGYVDGYVLPVPRRKLMTYRKMAHEAGNMWKKHGALDYFECVGDDLGANVGGMQMVKFPKMAGSKPGETVVFAFVTYKSKSHRNKVNAKVMKDPAMNDPKNKSMPMPFEAKRMAYGGFNTIVQL